MPNDKDHPAPVVGPALGGELRLLSRGQLPGFVYRGGRAANEGNYLPVFTFHSIHPDDFERKLAHLKNNGYRTLSMAQVLGHLTGTGTVPLERAVVLTIDDGRLSTWTVAEPLLERYGMTATAFVIPGYLGEGPARETLRDTSQQVEEREDRQVFMRWSEVEALHERGVVGIESHTMLHRTTVTSLTPARFLHPGFDLPAYKLPMRSDCRQAWALRGPALERMLGTPMPRPVALLSQESGFDLPESVAEACRELARSQGPSFFKRRGWERLLTECYGKALKESGPAQPVDLEPVQRWELCESKRVLEERLPGKVVRHFCLPHSLACERSVRLVVEAGYESCLWGTHDARVANRPGHDPMRIGRLKHDYILCLPSKGRVGLPSILSGKVARRLSGRRGF